MQNEQSLGNKNILNSVSTNQLLNISPHQEEINFFLQVIQGIPFTWYELSLID